MAETNSQNTTLKLESSNGTVDLTPYINDRSIVLARVLENEYTTRPFHFYLTDDLINDAISGLSQEEKVAFLQSIFGKDWQEHYQGDV